MYSMVSSNRGNLLWTYAYKAENLFIFFLLILSSQEAYDIWLTE